MPSVEINLDEFLKRFGLKTVRRLKLGQGAAGHMTTIGVAAIVCITVVAFAFPPSWPTKSAAIILIAALAFYLLHQLEKLAREAPEARLLEGAELVLSPKKDTQLHSPPDGDAASVSGQDEETPVRR